MPDALDAFLDEPETRDPFDAFLDEPEPSEWKPVASLETPEFSDYADRSLGNQARNTFANFAGAAGSGTADAIAALLSAGRDIDDASGGKLSGAVEAVTGVKPRDLNAAMTEFMRERSQAIPQEQGVDPMLADTLPAKFGQGLGSMVPVVASGPAAFGTTAAMMHEQGYQDALTHGASEEDAKKSAYLNAAVGGVTERLLGVPYKGLVSQLAPLAKKHGVPTEVFERLAQTTLGRAASGAAREGTQEGAQGAAANFIANTIVGYDPERGTFEGVPEAAFIGALVGAPVGAVMPRARTSRGLDSAAPERLSLRALQPDSNLPQTDQSPRAETYPTDEASSQPDPTNVADELQDDPEMLELVEALLEQRRTTPAGPEQPAQPATAAAPTAEAHSRYSAPRSAQEEAIYAAPPQAMDRPSDYAASAMQSVTGAILPSRSGQQSIAPRLLGDDVDPLAFRRTEYQPVQTRPYTQPNEQDYDSTTANQRTIAASLPRSAAGAIREAEQGSGDTRENDLRTIGSATSPTVQFKLQAHHGTPHKVEQFKLEKIGTGEGAQVYGWGLYFAENKEVAEQYRNQLGEVRIGDSEYDNDNPSHRAAYYLQQEIAKGGTIESRRATLQRSVAHMQERYSNRSEWKPIIQREQEELAALNNPLPDYRNTGNTYAVELDVEPDELLDWDKPLSEQSEKVKTALDAVADKHWQFSNALVSVRGSKGLSGDKLYRSLVSITDVQSASAELRAAGISGIRYKDQGSREGEGGTSNYVIFDESKIKITHENGKPLTAEERAAFMRQASGKKADANNKNIDTRSGQPYSLPPEIRNAATVPSPDLDKNAALARFSAAVWREENRGAQRKQPQTRLERVSFDASLPADSEIRKAEAVARSQGKEVVWYRALGTHPYNGAAFGHPRFVFVNVNGTLDPVFVTAGHEVTHLMQREAPEIYRELEAVVLRQAKNRSRFDENRRGRRYEERQLNEELVADFVGESLQDPTVLTRALGGNPTLLERVQAFIRRVLEQIRNRLGRNDTPTARGAIANLRTAERALEKAWREWSQGGNDGGDGVRLARQEAGLQSAPIEALRDRQGTALSANRQSGTSQESQRTDDETYYHGTQSDFVAIDPSNRNGLYFTKDRNHAGRFARARNGKILTATVKPRQVFDFRKPEHADLVERLGLQPMRDGLPHWSNSEDIRKIIEPLGFDAALLSEPSFGESERVQSIEVYDPSTVRVTNESTDLPQLSRQEPAPEDATAKKRAILERLIDANIDDLLAGRMTKQDILRMARAELNPRVTSTKSEPKPSKIGQSIEAKAVAAKLTKGFEGTALYGPITMADQAQQATALVKSSLTDARAIIRGDAPLPSGLRGTALITAMEEHLLIRPDAQTAYELANSPLVTKTSEAAQEMRLMAERSPDAITATFHGIREARKAGSKQRGETTERIRKEVKKEIKRNASKPSAWTAFVQEITCR